MRIFTCVVAATLVAFWGAENAFADAEAGQGYFSVMGSYIDDDEDRGIRDGAVGGQFGFGYGLTDAVNVEAFLSVASIKGDSGGGPDQEHLGFGVDLQRVFRRTERFSPYIHAGLGYFEVDARDATKQYDVMWSAGAGFLVDMFRSNIALRGEWRYRTDAAASVDLSDNLFSLGLQIPFGAGTPKFVDSDGDGVADGIDRCPNTPGRHQC